MLLGLKFAKIYEFGDVPHFLGYYLFSNVLFSMIKYLLELVGYVDKRT